MYTNVLHMKQMLYYRRSCFSGLEMHVTYHSQAMVPNTQHSLFLIHHFVLISFITRKSWGTCNSTTPLMNPLLLRMHCFRLKAAKQLQTTSCGPIKTLLSCYLVRKYEWQQNSGCLRLYYTSNNHIPSKVASFRSIKWGASYKLPIQPLS